MFQQLGEKNGPKEQVFAVALGTLLEVSISHSEVPDFAPDSSFS